MKLFFDTSVLVAAFLGHHPHHDASLVAFLSADKKTACCAAHSLAEVYSTVTRLPGKTRLSGEQALLFLDNIRERLTLISLDGREYYNAIEHAAAAGIIGGAAYDALLGECAIKAGADTIYTWNVSDFQRLGSAIARRVKTP
jgi:predicted nucleic acid-binding protein